MRRTARFFRDRRGASAVEFALLAGPFLLLVLGTVEFGRAYWYRHVIQETAINAARCVAVPQPACAANGTFSPTAATSHIVTAAGAKGVTLEAGDIAVDRDATCFGSSGFSRVTISYRFVTPLPTFLSSLASGPVMGATSCFPTQPG